eukprot:SAG11_NODE_2764_length_2999_cov_2.267931_2_plen_240_part_00
MHTFHFETENTCNWGDTQQSCLPILNETVCAYVAHELNMRMGGNGNLVMRNHFHDAAPGCLQHGHTGVKFNPASGAGASSTCTAAFPCLCFCAPVGEPPEPALASYTVAAVQWLQAGGVLPHVAHSGPSADAANLAATAASTVPAPSNIAVEASAWSIDGLPEFEVELVGTWAFTQAETEAHGLSGLTYDAGRRRWYALSDRGGLVYELQVRVNLSSTVALGPQSHADLAFVPRVQARA